MTGGVRVTVHLPAAFPGTVEATCGERRVALNERVVLPAEATIVLRGAGVHESTVWSFEAAVVVPGPPVVAVDLLLPLPGPGDR